MSDRHIYVAPVISLPLIDNVMDRGIEQITTKTQLDAVQHICVWGIYLFEEGYGSKHIADLPNQSYALHYAHMFAERLDGVPVFDRTPHE